MGECAGGDYGRRLLKELWVRLSAVDLSRLFHLSTRGWFGDIRSFYRQPMTLDNLVHRWYMVMSSRRRCPHSEIFDRGHILRLGDEALIFSMVFKGELLEFVLHSCDATGGPVVMHHHPSCMPIDLLKVDLILLEMWVPDSTAIFKGGAY